jgi:iron complex outermembrane receptor protein
VALTLNGEMGPNEGAGFYYVGKFVYKDSEAAGFFRLPNDDRTVRSIYPNGYLPLLTPKQYDFFATLGDRGSIGRYDFDLSNTAGFNRIDITVDDSVNASLGNQSPTSFDAGNITYWQDSLNADFTTARALGFATPTQIAFGAEGRFEEYRIGAGETSSWVNGGVPVLDGPDAGASTSAGAQLYPGFTPQNANDLTRSVSALYIEGEQKFLEHFDSRLAARNEYYSDFGNTLNGKVLFDYKPNDALVFRTSFATGYKAPSLHQMGYYRTAINVNSANSQITQSGTFPVDESIAKLLGAKDLDPEKSRRMSFGATYVLAPNVQFSADWFSIVIKDRIALSGMIDNSSELPVAAQDYMNANGITSASYFLNAVDTTTRGFHLSTKYDALLSGHKLTLTGEFQHTKSEIDAIHIPDAVAYLGDAIFDRAEQERLLNYLPHDKAILSVKYHSGPLEVTTRANYFGKVLYVQSSDDPSSDQWFHAKTTFDLDVSYKLTEHTVLAAGGNNIFNTLPDYRNSDPPFNGRGDILQFRGISPFDYTGAFYYVRAVFSF